MQSTIEYLCPRVKYLLEVNNDSYKYRSICHGDFIHNFTWEWCAMVWDVDKIILFKPVFPPVVDQVLKYILKNIMRCDTYEHYLENMSRLL